MVACGGAYLSGGLDQRGGARAAQQGAGPLGPLQQEPGPGDVAPGQAQTGLGGLPAVSPPHVIGHLERGGGSSLSTFASASLSPPGVTLLIMSRYYTTAAWLNN